MALNRRRITTIALILAAGGLVLWFVASQRRALPIASTTSPPTQIAPAAFTINQCVKVTRPTNLRFGPGIDYPVFTNIPARPQPPMTIIDNPIIGLTCSDVSNCQPYIEDWWWPVQLIWADTGDIDRGWLSQSDLKPCA